MTILTGAGGRISYVSDGNSKFGVAATERFTSFADAGAGNNVTYQLVIEDPSNGNWEIGTYTYDKTNNAFKRHSVSSSSNSNNAITPTAGSYIYSGAARQYVNAPGLNTNAIGYGTGAGGSVTQLTGKSTAVSLNTLTGQIIMNNASLASGAVVFFTVNNTQVAATDVPIVAQVAGGGTAGAYEAWVEGVAANAFVIGIRNVTGGALGEAVKLNFNVLKGASS